MAKAICTPLRKQDSIVLYDAATGQKLQSTCRGFLVSCRKCLCRLSLELSAQSMDSVIAWCLLLCMCVHGLTFSLCLPTEVTGKIEEFFQGVPEQVATGVEYVANQVNDTLGFFKYMQSTASGIAMHLADNAKSLEEISKSKPIQPCFAAYCIRQSMPITVRDAGCCRRPDQATWVVSHNAYANAICPTAGLSDFGTYQGYCQEKPEIKTV